MSWQGLFLNIAPIQWSGVAHPCWNSCSQSGLAIPLETCPCDLLLCLSHVVNTFMAESGQDLFPLGRNLFSRWTCISARCGICSLGPSQTISEHKINLHTVSGYQIPCSNSNCKTNLVLARPNLFPQSAFSFPSSPIYILCFYLHFI